MDENSNSDFQHPLHAALRIFNAAVRSAFDRVIGASNAFWHPWFREPEKQEVPAKQGPNTPAEEAPQPTKRGQRRKPIPQKATVEKKPEPSPKRSLKEELELEREERTQKTERLRKLRLAKQAAANQKKNHNGRGEAPVEE
jgi:hypothetical protein